MDFGTELENLLTNVLQRCLDITNRVTGVNESILLLTDLIDQVAVVMNFVLTDRDVELGEDRELLTSLVKSFTQLRDTFLRHTRNRSASMCTILPVVTESNGCGRPKYYIGRDTLDELHGVGFSWNSISKMLNVSRWTIRRRICEYGLDNLQRYSDLSDVEIDDIIKEYVSRHGSSTGEPLMSGYFKSKGFFIQRWRIRKALNRVAPRNVLLRWGHLTAYGT